MRTALLSVVFLLTLPGAALAHDDAAWIQANPAFKAPSGIHCCGPNHCGPNHCGRAGAGEIVRIAGGWRHAPSGTELKDDEAGVYDSIDADTWRCVWDGRLQCVFTGRGA